ncbi:MAG TPA: AmmeMemoRadiSam system protein B [Verrucomicrobiae bacterium]|nr:AmmeMemoRadiSam system protein B [Verrucomicrobiae bacterium]
MNLFATAKSSRVRAPAVAGRFYPGDPTKLRQTVEQLLHTAPAWNGPVPKALIAPHAGYLFSGPVAAAAYTTLAGGRGVVERVVLLGPAHFVGFHGVAATDKEAFATPLGRVAVDVPALNELVERKLVVRLEQAHADEHCLEVQLPFLQVLLDTFKIVPLVVGDVSISELGRLLDEIWGGPETLIIVSSDLSHYLGAAAARVMDESTATAIARLAPEELNEQQACGLVAIRSLLAVAAKHNLAARRLDLRNSADAGGPADRVVGYGAFAFGAVR